MRKKELERRLEALENNCRFEYRHGGEQFYYYREHPINKIVKNILDHLDLAVIYNYPKDESVKLSKRVKDKK